MNNNFEKIKITNKEDLRESLKFDGFIIIKLYREDCEVCESVKDRVYEALDLDSDLSDIKVKFLDIENGENQSTSDESKSLLNALKSKLKDRKMLPSIPAFVLFGNMTRNNVCNFEEIIRFDFIDESNEIKLQIKNGKIPTDTNVIDLFVERIIKQLKNRIKSANISKKKCSQ